MMEKIAKAGIFVVFLAALVVATRWATLALHELRPIPDRSPCPTMCGLTGTGSSGDPLRPDPSFTKPEIVLDPSSIMWMRCSGGAGQVEASMSSRGLRSTETARTEACETAPGCPPDMRFLGPGPDGWRACVLRSAR